MNAISNRISGKRSLLVVACLFVGEMVLAESPKLQIDGVDDLARENIVASIGIDRYACNLAPWKLEQLKQTFTERATSALQAVGYYHPNLDFVIDDGEACWTLQVTVEPGPAVKVQALDLTIDGTLRDEELISELRENRALRIGERLNHQHYKKLKSSVEAAASQLGYFSGHWTKAELLVDRQSNTARATLHYASGPRARFGDVTVEATDLAEEFVSQYLTLEADQPYSSSELIRQERLLRSSGYFDNVRVVANSEHAEAGRVPVAISLQLNKRFAYRARVGASTDTGPRIGLDYTDRRVNRHGHRANIGSHFSPVRNEITADYTIPSGHGGKNRIDLQAGYLYEDTDSSRSESYKLAVRQHELQDNDWMRSLFIEYLYEDFVTETQDDRSRFLMPGVSWQRSAVDNPVLPLNGWKVNTGVRAGAEAVLSSTDFAQWTASGKWIQSRGENRLLLRTDLATTAVQEYGTLPPSLRFFAGGDGSIRGFGYKSLGPRDSDGKLQGGLHFVTLSAEYERLIKDRQFGLAVFVDAGNAFNSLEKARVEAGVGFGIRYHSLIGPIRLDVAQDISGDRGPRLHLSMGLDL